MLEVNAPTVDIDVADITKFASAKKLKLQQFLKAALRAN